MHLFRWFIILLARFCPVFHILQLYYYKCFFLSINYILIDKITEMLRLDCVTGVQTPTPLLCVRIFTALVISSIDKKNF